MGRKFVGECREVRKHCNLEMKWREIENSKKEKKRVK